MQPEQSETQATEKTTEQRQTGQYGDPVAEIAELLGGAPEEERDQDSTETTDAPAAADDAPETAERPAEQTEAQTLRKLAERAGVSMKQLYALDLAVNDAGDRVTLGELKDAYLSTTELAAARESLEDQTAAQRAKALNQERAIATLLQAGNVPPQMMEMAQAMVDNKRLAEQNALYAVMPELRDDAELRAKTSADILALVKPYGITESDINNLHDSRFYLFAMDMVRKVQRLETADTEARRVRKTAGKTGSVSRRTIGRQGGKATEAQKLKQKALETGADGDRLAAVSALIGE